MDECLGYGIAFATVATSVQEIEVGVGVAYEVGVGGEHGVGGRHFELKVLCAD